MRWLAFILLLFISPQFRAQDATYQKEKKSALESTIGKLYPPHLSKRLETLEAQLNKKPGETGLLRQARWLLPDVDTKLPSHVSRVMGTLKFKHDSYPTSVLYTADDKGIITCSRDGTVKLWDLETGQATKTWDLVNPLGAMCLSPDGKLLAVAEGYRLAPSIDSSTLPSQDEYAIHIIDLVTGNIKWKLTGTKSTIHGLAFSNDGKQLASGAQPSKTEPLRLWNTETGKLDRGIKGIHAITNLAYSADNSRLFCTTSDKAIDLIDLKKDTVIQSTRERGNLFAMALSPDQSLLAVGGDFTEEGNAIVVRIYNTRDWKVTTTLGGHQTSIVSLAFHRDGKKLVSGTGKNECAIKVWDINQKTATAQYLGHTGDVLGIGLNKDGNNLATVSTDGNIRLWLTSQVKEPVTLKQSSGAMWVVAHQGKLLLMGGADKQATIRDLEASKELATFAEHQSPITAGCFRPDGLEVATGGGDFNIRLWDPLTGKPGITLTGHKGVITCLAYSPDGKRLYSASADKTIRIWDIAEKKALFTLLQHRSVVTSLAVNLEGSLLATGGADNLVRIWRTHDGSELRSLIGHSGAITGLCFSPGGKLLASISADGICKIWDPGSRTDALRTFAGHHGQLMSVAFSPNNKYLATAGADETIKVWSVANGNELRALTGHRDWISSITFLSDGESLVSASVDGTVRLWAESKAFEPPVFGHEYPIRYLALSPKGDQLASGSEDGKIILWDARTGNELGTLSNHLSPIRALAYSSDGGKLISADREQTIKLWDTNTRRELQSFTSQSEDIKRLGFLENDAGILAAIGSSNITLWKFEGPQLKTTPLKSFLGYERHCNSTAFAKGRVALGSTDGNIVHKKIVDFKPDLDELIKSFSVAVSEITLSADSSRLLAVNQENDFKIWNLTDNRLISTWKGRASRLSALAMSADGKLSLASYENGEIILWDDAGKELRSWKFRGLANDIIIKPDGKHAFAGMASGVIFQLDLP
jgi:WD40 repeat protein